MDNDLFARLSLKPVAIMAVSALSASSTSYAVINLDFVYNSSTEVTIATYNGTWDMDSGGGGSTATTTFNDSLRLYALNGAFDSLTASGGGFTSMPWTGGVSVLSHSGTSFGFYYNDVNSSSVYGPVGFTTNTPISGSITYDTTLSAFGFDALEIANGGTIVTAGGDVNWTASVVPEPSSYTLIFGFVTFAIVAIRRTRSSHSRLNL